MTMRTLPSIVQLAATVILVGAVPHCLHGQPAAAKAKSAPATSKAKDNQPPESATAARMMSAVREGNPRSARSLGASYLNLHPGTPRTGEHCHILAAFAYADVVLDKRDEAKQALGVFDKGCRHTAVRDDYRAEVARVKRVLNGEALSVVYPR